MQAKWVILLSGTPMIAWPQELYNCLRIIRPDIFYNFRSFGYRYCNPKEAHYGIDWTGSKNLVELHYLLWKHIMIWRLKKEVLTELPEKWR